MNLEVTKSTFQALASKFVLDRDSAIANINKLLYSEGDSINDLAVQMNKLTIAKLNIANTQEELNKAVNLQMAQQEGNKKPSDTDVKK